MCASLSTFSPSERALTAALTLLSHFLAVDFFGNDSDQAQAAQAVQTQHKSSVRPLSLLHCVSTTARARADPERRYSSPTN